MGLVAFAFLHTSCEVQTSVNILSVMNLKNSNYSNISAKTEVI